MNIAEVNDKKSQRLFHKVPHIIYVGDENFICPLETMVEDSFQSGKNPYLEEGKAKRWILQDDNGRLIGRIGAFYNKNKAYKNEQPTGGCGYFECVNDTSAAKILFEAAENWLESEGMEAMEGPVNAGENYLNWGLLVKGFEKQGFGMPYHKPYYLKLFQEYGFQTYFEQYSYHLDFKTFPDRFWKIAKWIANKPAFTFEHFTWKDKDRFIDDFVTIYNRAWQEHDHFNPLNPREVDDFLTTAKTIIDEEFIWYAYHEGEPIALFGMIPDLNQILTHLDGKLNLMGIIKFLWYKWRNAMTRTRILIMGIVPQFQGSGIESAIFWHQNEVMKKRPWINEIELSWAGDFNPKIVSLYKSVGGMHTKTHHTMRYLFDRTKPFHRMPIIQDELPEKK